MKFKFIIPLIIGIICYMPISYAQQASYPTEIINGKEYYRYKVLPAEGLYAISKKFGVTQSEINNINPQIYDGLKAGQEILIPKTATKPVTISAKTVADETEFVIHTVERRQTLFAISRKYNVTQEAIIQANPQIKEYGLKSGDVIRVPVAKSPVTSQVQPVTPVKSEIPVNKAETKPQQTAQATEPTLHIGSESNYITHVVDVKETLYSISRKYNVSVDAIKSLNPESAEVLKIGSTLKIPFNADAKDNNTVSAAATQQTVIYKPKPVAEKNTYKIAYLLPFMLANDAADPTIEKFIEFYMGSLLAINNAKNGDMNFEIFTFDIEKSETKVVEVLNKPEMQEMDLIFGPAYTAQVPVLADFAKRRKINTVIPFSSKITHIDSNPYIFQFNPDQDLQNNFMFNTINNRFKGASLLFVETGNSNWSDDGMDFFNYLIKRLEKQKIAFKKITGSEAENIQNYLTSESKNIVIFDTEDIKSVQTYLNKLYDLNAKYDLGVLGQYTWRNVSSKKPAMYYVSPFAGNKTATHYYEQEYNKYYGKMRSIANPRFDLLGYDLTTYFLSTMTKEGFSFTQSTQKLAFDTGVQSDFNFVKTEKNGGYINQKLYLIEDEAKRN